MSGKTAVVFICLILSACIAHAQKDFYLEPSFDGPFIVAGCYGVYLGTLVESYITPANLNTLVKEDINPLDRWAVNYFSESIKRTGNHFLALTALPVVIGIYGNSREYNNWDAITDGVMYLESLLFTYSMSHYIKGFEIRPKPRAYNTDLSYLERKEKSNASGFYSLNSALAANSVAFTDAVFSTRFPDSAWLPYIRIIGWTTVAFMGYTQIASGEHFPTDVIFGTAIGAASGYMVPLSHIAKPAVNLETILGGISLTIDF